MSVKPKGRPRRELDEALLQAAADEFLEFGYTDANLGRIAEAGKTTKPALYRRFPSKELLFEAVLEHISRDFELDLSFFAG
ncbi:MAG: helix-turn-helix transcriptional regulator [Pseudomonadales bacterium]|nr:helix-turn-helix transcriptional regulator [Pseudomonadales bacterium]